MVFGTKAEIDLMKVRGPTWTKMGKHIIHQIIPELAFYAENICSLMRTHLLLVYYSLFWSPSVCWMGCQAKKHPSLVNSHIRKSFSYEN